MGSLNMEKKWVFPLVISSLICVFLLATSFNTINHIFNIFPLRLNQTGQGYAETKVSQSPPPPPPGPKIPRFAYLVSGSKGDLEKLWRTLHALYHPRNHYVVHLDLESPAEERLELASRVEKHPMFSKFGNVYMTTKANMVTYRGPTMVSNTLHACAILLTNPRRPLPTAFKLFTGSAWMVLTRPFAEYLIWGWDNLPRTLLMYYTNFVSSPEGYFHTVICNAPEFARTAINHDLHYIAWDVPPRQHPHILTLNDTEKMIASGAAFARKFRQDDPALEKIDNELLGRRVGAFTPGGWCSDSPNCTEVGDINNIKPGPGADRLKHLIARVALLAKRQENQCK
ncbi:Beta-glucuronosyltransferase GlcAT14A [Linum perenne]